MIIARSFSTARTSLHLGLDAARATQNVLRILEAFCGSSSTLYPGMRPPVDTLKTIWQIGEGQVWEQKGDPSKWQVASPLDDDDEMKSSRPFAGPGSLQPPSLLSLHLADDRTALAKVQEANGRQSYLSLLRLDEPRGANNIDQPKHLPYDGWKILRQVQASSAPSKILSSPPVGQAFSSIVSTLQQYLSIEHGGGGEAHQQATALLAPETNLITVGIAPADDPPSEWSSPEGTLLSIPRSVYLQGVQQQTPHQPTSAMFDAILQVDVLPCQTAASAVVHVGNGAQTNVFVDHLLLGKEARDEEWKILSKTFAARPWPTMH